MSRKKFPIVDRCSATLAVVDSRVAPNPLERGQKARHELQCINSASIDVFLYVEPTVRDTGVRYTPVGNGWMAPGVRCAPSRRFRSGSRSAQFFAEIEHLATDVYPLPRDVDVDLTFTLRDGARKELAASTETHQVGLT
jgi:hypothetical protein